jgi:hypothetical protein
MKLKHYVLGVMIFGLGVVTAAVPAIAHHSFAAEFDATQPIASSGIITKMEWMNPHVYFYIDVEDEASGKVETWAWEMGSPNGLMRRGWNRNSMKIGDVVSVDGTRAKDGSRKANAQTVMLSSGERLFAASSQGNAN